ncbi:MAG: carboxypeptidase-like regulatory domain-containing protein [Nitrospinaceae bacterium]
MKKAWTGILAVGISLTLGITSGWAKKNEYIENSVERGGSLSGTVHFKGKAPPPILEDLNKGKNAEFCVSHPETEKSGIRPRIKVAVKDGKLKDAVIFFEDIKNGKPWPAETTNFDFKNCDIFPKVSVIRKTPKGMKEGLMTISNRDPDILHNPHGYSVSGANRKTLFNKPLPDKGAVADVTKSLKRFKKKKDHHFFLQCDQHNFMEADARIVWNPYYAVSAGDGTFKIDQIPPGKYKVTVWHPYVGQTTREITVEEGSDIRVDFELASN